MNKSVIIPFDQQSRRLHWLDLRLGITLTNNDILRRLRYTFDLYNATMIKIFALADLTVTDAQINAWLKKDDDPAFIAITDTEFATFLNGFINLKRGKREGEQPVPESQLNNNIVFQKLRIALNLKSEDIIDILLLAELRFSKHELGAFFRKPDNRHYRECKDQVLRNFLKGIQMQLRPSTPK